MTYNLPMVFPTALNEAQPAFPSATYTTAVDENVAIGTAVYTVPAATDTDDGDDGGYRLFLEVL